MGWTLELGRRYPEGGFWASLFEEYPDVEITITAGGIDLWSDGKTRTFDELDDGLKSFVIGIPDLL